MLHRTNRIRYLLLFCIALMFLTACAGSDRSAGLSSVSAEADELTASGDAVRTYLIPQENQRGTSMGGYSPSTTSNGYYTVSDKVRYYDAEAGVSVILCAQPGCTHTDETCQAWVGQAISYIEYHGQLLATVQNEEGSAQLVRKDLTTGDITVLESWDGSDTDLYNVSIGRVADNLVQIGVYRTHMTWEEGILRSENFKSIWLYDLTDGSWRELFSEEEPGLASFMALSEKYALVTYITEESLQELDEMDEETLRERYGENANFEEYYRNIMPRELRLYDLETGDFTVIADTEREHYAASTDFCYTYGKKVLYQCGDTLYLFDLDEAKSSALLTMEGIINYSLMDHKAFFVAEEGEESYYEGGPIGFYWADIDDGVPVRLENAGNTEVAEFNALYECDSFFIGYYKSAYYRIDKEDFYADCYENAVLAP